MAHDIRDTPTSAHRFALALAQGLRANLGAGLRGVYLHGSTATGDAVPGTSDLDLIAVCAQPLTDEQRDALRALLAASVLPPDLPTVDFGLLTAATAAQPADPVRWEAMLRGTRGDDGLIVTDLGNYPGELLDLEMARQRGIALVGPAPGDLLAPIPPAWVLDAYAAELRKWAGRRHYEDPASGILNACRAWRYVEERVLASKASGGAWARPRTATPHLIDAALARRNGAPKIAMPDAEVNAFVRHALRLVETAAETASSS